MHKRTKLINKIIPNKPTLIFDLFFDLHLLSYKFDMYKYLRQHSKIICMASAMSMPRRYYIMINHIPVQLIETVHDQGNTKTVHFNMHVQCTYRDALKQIKWFYMLRDSILQFNILADDETSSMVKSAYGLCKKTEPVQPTILHMPTDTQVYIKYHCLKMLNSGYVEKVKKQVGCASSNKMIKLFKHRIWRDCILVE